MLSISDNRWYALFVNTGHEDRVKEKICFKLKDDIRVIVPKRKMKERKKGKWEEKIRVLFPGYILLNGNISIARYNLIRQIPGVIRLLGDSDGPQEIDEQEIKVIKDLISQNELIGFSSIYVNDGRIIVSEGPLLGLEGYIKALDKRKGRVKVMLNLLGETRVVELSVSMVQPV